MKKRITSLHVRPTPVTIAADKPVMRWIGEVPFIRGPNGWWYYEDNAPQAVPQFRVYHEHEFYCFTDPLKCREFMLGVPGEAIYSPLT